MDFEETKAYIEKIKAYMKAHKITYPALASMTGLSLSCITKIFGGYAKYPRIDTIKTIERALGLEGKENRPPSDMTESEKAWFDLYYSLTDENKELLVKMVDVFKDLPAERRRFVLEAIRLATGQK